MSAFSKNFKFLLIIIILSIFFGFAAGIISSSFTILPSSQPTLPNDNAPTIPELVMLRQFIGLKQDLQARSVYEAVSPALVGFYRKKAVLADVSSQIYNEENFLGNGFVLTNNGWLISTSEVFSNIAQQSVIAVSGNTPYEIDKIVKDNLTSVIFVKVKAVNLPVAKLADTEQLEIGQSALLASSLSQISIANIESVNFSIDKKIIKSTEIFGNYLTIDKEIKENYKSGILLNLNGEVIGIANQDYIIEVNKFRRLIDGVLKDGIIQRVYMGLDYIELSSAVGLSSELTFGLTKGALVYAVDSGSPASQAGLQKNDIVTKIDGRPISDQNTLTELIQDYKVGDLIYVTTVRDGQEFIVEVYLGTM